MNNYENNIIDAIETIVDNSIAKTDYDRTIQGTIFKLLDSSLGQYTIKYQDSYFDAFAADTTVEYLEGTSVYILIPNSDMSKDKTILGAVDGYRIQGVTAITDADASEPVGYNCVNGENTFELCSYKPDTETIIYDRSDNIDLVGLDTAALKNFLKESSYLVAGASFRTALDGSQKIKGNYGIIFELGFKAQASDEIILRKYVVDINKMNGNPYSLTSSTSQVGYFEIDGENFEYVNNITIFEKDFPNTDLTKPNDLFISELQLYGANKISEEEYNVARLVINTPQGNYFSSTEGLQTEKTLVAKIKVNGTEIDLSKQTVEYYWFRENDDINITSQKYNYYGGEGWECLNDFSLVDSSNPDIVKWSSATNTWKITKASIRSQVAQYKCIAIYGSIILQRIITIKNEGAVTTTAITSDLGVDFIDGLGYPTLTCLINNSETPVTGYTYKWSKIDNNGLYTSLPETTELNQDYETAFNNYYGLLAEIRAERAFPNAVAAQLEAYKEALDAFEKITRVKDNKIYNINMAEVVDYVAYKCSVYYNNIYVGTESIILYNKNSQEKDYYIEFINGTQIFKYDEKGISPCDVTKENPQEILPLSFNIINKNGLDITEEMLNKCQINWTIPEENTLIQIPDGTDLHSRQLTFTIDNLYDNTKINNTIQLTIQYKNQKIIEYTNLTFLKEGDIGTNGTDCYCTIVPNTTQQIDYPMIINGVLNYTPDQAGKWFKAQVWRAGKLIFEGTDSGNSIDNKTVSIRWSVKKNKYNAQVSDPSTINVTTNNFSTTGYYQEDGSGAKCPANIIQCRIIYNQIEYYVTIPMITVSYNAPYQLYLEPRTGFNFVTYSSDGRYPKYNDNKPFEIQVMQTINGVRENISLLHSNQYGVVFNWYIRGQVYDTKTGLWIDKTLFEVDETTTLNQNQIKLVPVSEYSGECVSTGLECICKKKSDNITVIGKIHIPIHCMLNRYANAAINSWDGNSVEINDTDGYILTPQVGAGTKDEQNRFTGMLMGSVKDNSNGVTKTGLLGYDTGQQSLFLDAESGGAIFGKDMSGQITIDPQSNKSYLFNHNYWRNYNEKGFPTNYSDSNLNGAGMLIDLATPQIVFGSGNFKVDEDGNVTCGEMLTTKGLLTMLNYTTEGTMGWRENTLTTDVTYRTINTYGDSQSIPYPNKFYYTPNTLDFSCYIPEGFTIYKAICTLEQYPFSNYFETNTYYGEGQADFPSYGTLEHGSSEWAQGTILGSASDPIGVWYVPQSAYYRKIGTYISGLTDQYVIDFTSATMLGGADTGFYDAITYPAYANQTQRKIFDFTALAKNLLVPGELNLLAVGPKTLKNPISLTWSRKNITNGYVYRSSPVHATYAADCIRKTGYVKAQILLFGYYDPSLVNND